MPDDPEECISPAEEYEEAEGSQEYTPWFSKLAVFVCVLVFLKEMQEAGWAFQPLDCAGQCENGPCDAHGAPCESNMMLGPKLEVMRRLGAKDGDAIFGHGEWWRLLSCSWLHAGLFHLASNSMGILNLGPELERSFGGWRVGAVYLLSGIGGMFASLLFLPSVPSVGASGSVFGLMGAFWADLAFRVLACQLCGVLRFLPLVIFTGINLAIGFRRATMAPLTLHSLTMARFTHRHRARHTHPHRSPLTPSRSPHRPSRSPCPPPALPFRSRSPRS